MIEAKIQRNTKKLPDAPIFVLVTDTRDAARSRV